MERQKYAADRLESAKRDNAAREKKCFAERQYPDRCGHGTAPASVVTGRSVQFVGNDGNGSSAADQPQKLSGTLQSEAAGHRVAQYSEVKKVSVTFPLPTVADDFAALDRGLRRGRA